MEYTIKAVLLGLAMWLVFGLTGCVAHATEAAPKVSEASKDATTEEDPFADIPSISETDVNRGRREMYDRIKEHIFDQCVQNGCNFRLPQYENLTMFMPSYKEGTK